MALKGKLPTQEEQTWIYEILADLYILSISGENGLSHQYTESELCQIAYESYGKIWIPDKDTLSIHILRKIHQTVKKRGAV